jgi:two-component system, NarL family, response regulator YdfI
MLQVLVIALSPIVRMGLATVLATNPKFQVVGSGTNFEILTENIATDVILFDSGVNQEEAIIEQLHNLQQSSIPLVAITSQTRTPQYIDMLLRAGVRGLLPPESSESEIILTVEVVAAGMVILHPEILEDLLTLKSTSTLIPNSSIQILTPREIEVLQLLGSGLGNKAIAQNLHLSEHTIKFHISSIFQKLSVSTRTEAVTVGVRLGLIIL